MSKASDSNIIFGRLNGEAGQPRAGGVISLRRAGPTNIGVHPAIAATPGNLTSHVRYGYPSHALIEMNGITQVIEHRKIEPVFEVNDDPDVRKELAS